MINIVKKCVKLPYLSFCVWDEIEIKLLNTSSRSSFQFSRNSQVNHILDAIPEPKDISICFAYQGNKTLLINYLTF